MSEITKYLLPSETRAIEVRHHWAALSGYAGTAAAFWAGGLLALWLFIDVALLRATFVFFLLFTVAWFLWMVGEWYIERFVVTDRRVLLLTGILTKRVAIMPLAKVTDLTYERTVVGRLLGYGVFVIESAGQQQALSRIEYIPHPDRLYQEVSGLLFGGAPSSDDGTGSGGPPGPRPSGSRAQRPPGPPGPPGPPPRPALSEGGRGRHAAPSEPLEQVPPIDEHAAGAPSAPIDVRPWELPQSADQRAAAPTAPLPSVR